MDITLFLKKEEKKSKKQDTSTLFINLIKDLQQNKDIDILEFTYLLNFCKENGPIINAKWFIDIINKINSYSKDTINGTLIKLSSKLFPHLISENGKNVKLATDRILQELLNEKSKFIMFTDDQQIGLTHILNFLTDYNSTMFGLYGYAGTGKTTLISEIVNHLIKYNYIKSIVFAAPTNKAVNIIKSKFRRGLKELLALKYGKKSSVTNENNMDDNLYALEKHNMKIDFVTIHRLLNYKNDFSAEGERIFVKDKKSHVHEYDLVIIDECSMIPIQIIYNLIEEIKTTATNAGNNYHKIPKILFVGDPAQLPPVNEDISSIFMKNKYDITFKDFIKIIPDNCELDIPVTTQEEILVKKHEVFTTAVLSMKFFILKEVVRNKIGNVVALCYNIRQWVNHEINMPILRNFKGNGVFLYKYNKGSKIKSEWFINYAKNFQESITKNHSGNIILAWTNNQCDEYNEAMRRILFNGKEKLSKFERGDVLILNDFYTFDETRINDKNDKKDNSNKFYTSEQIKVIDVDITHKKCCDFSDKLTDSALRIKNAKHIAVKYANVIHQINKMTSRIYNVYKLQVVKLIDNDVDEKKSSKPTIINVLLDEYVGLWKNEQTYASDMIHKMRKLFEKTFKEQINQIDKEIIRPLWRSWNKIFIEPFANVNYGASMSIHKSQSSTYFNVYVDVDDILNNKRIEEMKKLIYTAITRSSNELHLFI